MGKLQATGIVLAGGRSSRMGQDKALLDWSGRPLLAHVADSVAAWFDEALVVTGNTYPFLNLPIIQEKTPGLGPLGGLEAGLAAARHPLVFLCACDMPFLHEGLVRHLVGRGESADAVVPVVQGRPEPLCAVYARRVLPSVRSLLAERTLKLQALLDRVRTRTVPEAEWGRFGPAELLFFNCNTPEDIETARRMGAS